MSDLSAELRAFVEDEQAVADWIEKRRRFVSRFPGGLVAAKKALETRRWLALLTDREAKLSAVRELAAYRDVGCMSGDCPHDTQAQCNASLAAEYAEFLKDIAVHTKETQ